MLLEIRRHEPPERPWTYALLDARQREVAARVLSGGPGALLLSEVAPVITVGRRTPAGDVTAAELGSGARAGTPELYRVDRGGLATWHGPGQWVLFAVDRLERWVGDRRGVRKMVGALLEVARLTAASLRPEGDLGLRVGDGAELGVWTPRGKFAAVGIQVSQGVVLHGLSVNGFRTPGSFAGLRPCGLDLPVDYLLPDPSGFEELGERLVHSATRVLG